MVDLENLKDEEVVEIVRSKDKEAYSEIIRRYQLKLVRYADYMLGDTQVASDVVQESFISAYINLNGFNTKKKFSSWIYRITHNNAISQIRRNKKQISLNLNLDYSSPLNLEDDLIKKELINNTNKCLDRMPVLYKEVLVLMYLEDKSYQEISDILRIPMGTVGVRIKRAKLIFFKLCQKQIK